MLTKRIVLLVSCVAMAVSCSRETAIENVQNASDKVVETTQNVTDSFDSAVPIGTRTTREEIERERFNAEWRRLRSFQTRRTAQPVPAQPSTSQPVAAPPSPPQPAAAPPPVPVTATFVVDPKFAETLKGINTSVLDTLPLRVPIKGDVNGPSVLRAQVLLDRARYAVGAIDGRWGKNSEIAVYWFQAENGIEPTGEIDEPTFRALLGRVGSEPTLLPYVLTADDMKGPFTKIPEDVYEKEKLDCLCYENIGEKLAEQFHMTQELLASLNPGVNLTNVQAGQTVTVTNVRKPEPENAPDDVQKIVVSVKGSYLHALDASGRVMLHAPTTLGNKYDPSPTETQKVVATAFDPKFRYQPKLFHEVPDSDPEANLKPGPNSPVGKVWMALDKPHFGIHGTGDPETIGYASSHGCVRLTNWDALDLARRVGKGVPVEFVDTRGEK